MVRVFPAPIPGGALGPKAQGGGSPVPGRHGEGQRLRTLTEITLPRPRRAKQRKRGCALVKLANLYRSLSLVPGTVGLETRFPLR